MDEKQGKNTELFAKNFTEKVFLRYGCAFMTFLIIGIVLGIAFHNAGIIVIFIGVFHAIIWLAPYWQPAYSIIHKIMGNPNIPARLPNYQRKWWFYIVMAIKVIILFLVLRLGFQLLFQ